MCCVVDGNGTFLNGTLCSGLRLASKSLRQTTINSGFDDPMKTIPWVLALATMLHFAPIKALFEPSNSWGLLWSRNAMSWNRVWVHNQNKVRIVKFTKFSLPTGPCNAITKVCWTLCVDYWWEYSDIFFTFAYKSKYLWEKIVWVRIERWNARSSRRIFETLRKWMRLNKYSRAFHWRTFNHL